MCEIQKHVPVLTLSQYTWLMSEEGGDGLVTTLGTLLLLKNALSLIKASFLNNKAVPLLRGVIRLLFFFPLPKMSREFSSKSLLQRRKAISRARAPCPAPHCR